MDGRVATRLAMTSRVCGDASGFPGFHCFRGDDLAVADLHDAVGFSGNLGVVSNQNDRVPSLGEFSQKRHDRSRQPRRCISVDFPEPDAPMRATNSPAFIVSEIGTRRAAGAAARLPAGGFRDAVHRGA